MRHHLQNNDDNDINYIQDHTSCDKQVCGGGPGVEKHHSVAKNERSWTRKKTFLDFKIIQKHRRVEKNDTQNRSRNSRRSTEICNPEAQL